MYLMIAVQPLSSPTFSASPPSPVDCFKVAGFPLGDLSDLARGCTKHQGGA
jgi:hypothetical protein